MTYRWTGTHAFRDHANDRVIDPGEELPANIADDVAAAHPYDVERIDDPDGDEESTANATSDTADSGDDGESDGFDADAWLDQSYTTRAERVQNGEVDDHLQAVRDVETSSTVEDAVDERLAEIEA